MGMSSRSRASRRKAKMGSNLESALETKGEVQWEHPESSGDISRLAPPLKIGDVVDVLNVEGNYYVGVVIDVNMHEVKIEYLVNKECEWTRKENVSKIDEFEQHQFIHCYSGEIIKSSYYIDNYICN